MTSVISSVDAPVRLQSFSTRDFRNLERVDLAVPAAGLALVGDNGQGKTNFLEAIYYVQVLRSARGARDADLVRFGAPAFHLSAEGEVDTPVRIAVGYERATKRKKVTRDGVEAARLSDVLGALPSVMLSPRDVELVAGAPSARRRFLDIVLALTSRRYLVALQDYRAALARRNAALRAMARGGDDVGRIAVWEPSLAEHGAVLWTERTAWVERKRTEFARLCATIGESAPVSIRYAASAERVGPGGESVSLQDALAAAFEARRPVDIRRGVTHTGPHRDDLDISLGGRSLRIFGSAGQQRTAAIALRLLEASTLREHVGHTPLVLLDDPFAELDLRRATRILELLRNAGLGQTILAVPRAADIPPEMVALPRFTIAGGVVRADA
jgi:DNA replication and repair protein RecF